LPPFVDLSVCLECNADIIDMTIRKTYGYFFTKLMQLVHSFLQLISD